MGKAQTRTTWRIIFIFILVTAVFQAIDYAAVILFPHHLVNDQIIFGSVLNNSWAIVFSLVAVAVFLTISRFLRPPMILSVLVVSGATSNIVDRLLQGGVVDYIDLQGYSLVNVSDMVICVALAIICIRIIFEDTKKRPE